MDERGLSKAMRAQTTWGEHQLTGKRKNKGSTSQQCGRPSRDLLANDQMEGQRSASAFVTILRDRLHGMSPVILFVRGMSDVTGREMLDTAVPAS